MLSSWYGDHFVQWSYYTSVPKSLKTVYLANERFQSAISFNIVNWRWFLSNVDQNYNGIFVSKLNQIRKIISICISRNFGLFRNLLRNISKTTGLKKNFIRSVLCFWHHLLTSIFIYFWNCFHENWTAKINCNSVEILFSSKTSGTSKSVPRLKNSKRTSKR